MRFLIRIINKSGFLFLVCLCFGYLIVNAQQVNKTVLRGVVLEDKTGLYIPYAVIVVDGTSEGTSSDSEGRFVLQTSHPSPNLKVSCMGYNPVVINIPSGFTGYLTIKLAASTITLNEVVVKAERVKYRNKENPAVSLIDSVIANKQKNRIENFDYLQYEKYEKVQFSLSNISESIKKSKLLNKVNFIFNNIDTSKQPGKEVLPMYITESLSDYFYRKTPKATNEIVKANKMVSLEGYLDNQGMTGYIKYLYENINIYDNNILFLTNQFISPISVTAATFYRYYIIDTVTIGERKCARLFFTPRNKTDMLFQGYLFVTLNGAYAVNKVDMAVNSKINLNWVKDTKIVQEFENYQQQGWVISKDELSVDFGITKNGLGVFGQRSVSYKKYNINNAIPESKFTDVSPNVDSVRQPDSFWEQNRHMDLTKSEKGVYTTIDSLKHVKAFVRTLDLFRILIASFHDFGPVEIGPIITYYSYNPIEGSKVRFGGRTTPKFSKKINFDGYLAYGLKDQKFKYNIGATYSFTHKTIYNFPVRSLKVDYQVDTKVPGQELYFVQEGNAMLSLNRGVEDKLFYNKSLKVDYLHEFKNHFSYSLGYNYTRQSPGGTLNFNTSNYLSPVNNIPYLNISEVHLGLRYAPFEDFYQGKLYRTPITNKYPVFELKYSYGSKALGNDYNYHSLRFSAYKRFYPSVIGYTTVTLDAGKIFGKVPYPLLDIHNANQSYFYQSTAYNLMNFLEFVSDQYTSLNVDHCFNGFIFNKIPLFNRLGLREIVTFKVLYGGLSKSNNPDYQPDLLKFPTDKDGNPTTFALGKAPYAEVSVGVSNIFKFVRIELVRRLTYLDNPNVSKTGIRIMFKFDL